MKTRVLYNGSCPICSREISAYQRYVAHNDLPVGFEDLNAADLADWGVTPAQAAERIHVIKDGMLYSGMPAFALVWDEMPRFRWLATLVRVPGIAWIVGKAYDHMLAPGLYALHKRRQARKA